MDTLIFLPLEYAERILKALTVAIKTYDGLLSPLVQAEVARRYRRRAASAERAAQVLREVIAQVQVVDEARDRMVTNLSRSVDELSLSARPANCLRNSGTYTSWLRKPTLRC